MFASNKNFLKTTFRQNGAVMHFGCSQTFSWTSHPLFLKQKNLCFWTDLWLTGKKTSVKFSTYIRYRNLIEHHIDPYFGRFKISQIHQQMIQEYMAYLLQSGRLDQTGGLSPKTVEDILHILKDVFRFAQSCGVECGCGFDRLAVRKEDKRIRVLSPAEEYALLQVLLDHTDPCKLGVLLAMYSGIRLGELCALQWKDISLKEQVVIIRKTIQRLQKAEKDEYAKTQVFITSPKSFHANRTIPLTDFLVHQMKPFAAGPEAFLLSGSGVPVEPRTMQNRFHTYLKAGCISSATFHTLRHTFATRCVENGFDIKALSEVLGHSSVKITLDRYVHTSLEQKKRNMKKMDPLKTAEFSKKFCHILSDFSY